MSELLDNARQNNRPRLQEQELELIRIFFNIQWRRTRPSLEQLRASKKEQITDFIEEFDSRYRIRSPMSDKDTSIRDVISDWDSVFADAVSKSILFEEYVDFSRKGLALGLVRDHRKALIIGDSPVIFYRPTDCDIRYEPKSEIYMPVAKDVVLFIAGGDGYRSVIPIENTTVDDINHIVALQSTVIASQSRKLSAAIQKRLTK